MWIKAGFRRRTDPVLQMLSRTLLEKLYRRYNRREYVNPDPLQFLYRYKDLHDMEIAELIASCLAYGRVQQICKNVSLLLGRIKEPYNYVKNSTFRGIEEDLEGFKHRFTKPYDIAFLLTGVKKIIAETGSINSAVLNGINSDDENTIPGIVYFVDLHAKLMGDRVYYLLPSPDDGSACKRLNLYMKWMVRKDDVDPGGWRGINTSMLVVPLDVHMHRICTKLGMTARKIADMKAALQITGKLKEIAPDDPTRYDFALTRMGMWDNRELIRFYERCNVTDNKLSFV